MSSLKPWLKWVILNYISEWLNWTMTVLKLMQWLPFSYCYITSSTLESNELPRAKVPAMAPGKSKNERPVHCIKKKQRNKL